MTELSADERSCVNDRKVGEVGCRVSGQTVVRNRCKLLLETRVTGQAMKGSKVKGNVLASRNPHDVKRVERRRMKKTRDCRKYLRQRNQEVAGKR